MRTKFYQFDWLKCQTHKSAESFPFSPGPHFINPTQLCTGIVRMVVQPSQQVSQPYDSGHKGQISKFFSSIGYKKHFKMHQNMYIPYRYVSDGKVVLTAVSVAVGNAGTSLP